MYQIGAAVYTGRVDSPYMQSTYRQQVEEKVKEEYTAGVVATMDLQSTITSEADPTWAFANTPQNIGVIQVQLNDINGAITPKFRNI